MRRILGLLALAAAAAACGGGGGTTGPQIIIVSGGVTYYVVTSAAGQDTTSTLPGQTIQMKGTALDGSFSVVTGTWIPVWRTGNAAVATVDANGLTSAIAAGTTYIYGSIRPDSSHTLTDSTLVIVLTPQ